MLLSPRSLSHRCAAEGPFVFFPPSLVCEEGIFRSSKSPLEQAAPLM